MALPATKTDAPAAAVTGAVCTSMPPSTSMATVEPPVVDLLARPADLRHHLGYERLTAEAGMDGHEQHHVDLIQPLGIVLKRCLGVDGQSGVEAERAHLVDQGLGPSDLHVDRAPVGPRLGETPPGTPPGW